MRSHIFPLPLARIQIDDPLFRHYAGMIAAKLVPYQWEVLNDRAEHVEKSYCVQNFRIAAGELKAERKGAVFCDTDAYKWLETLAYCLQAGSAKEFEPKADEFIALIGRAQAPDGYLNTYFSVCCPQEKWCNLSEGHELYCAGHLIEAAVAYYQATGKDALLSIAKRFADLICTVFGPGKHPGYPGHQEIELALVKLGRLLGEEKYLEMARYFLTVRGREPNYILDEIRSRNGKMIFPEFRDYDTKYSQCHMPPAEQKTAEGHAVRAVYMYSAMADVALDTGDEALKAACKQLWENLTEKRMYITGGIGSSGHLERFTTDYDLPNDRMYCESCASIGLMMFGQRMAALTRDAKYYDAVERALCNTVLAGIAVEGDRYFYVNPLEVTPANCLEATSMAHVKPVRQPWFACACCPPNIARTLASVGQYIYAQDDRSVYINQLISSRADVRFRDTNVALELRSTLLQDGRVRLRVTMEQPQSITLRLRIPEYWVSPEFVLEGKAIKPTVENGYAVLALSRSGSQELEITGAVTPRWIGANTQVAADAGRIALEYGPYVYCLEETDNGGQLFNLYASGDAPAEAIPIPSGLPGTLPALRFPGYRMDSGIHHRLYAHPSFTLTPQTLTAIPYCLWCNREPGEMLVWMKALTGL